MIHTKYIPISHSNSESKLFNVSSKVSNQVASKFIKSQERFYEQCDDFLEEMCIFCEGIQVKAYKSIQTSSQLMQKYKMMKQIKSNIDNLWQKTKGNMKRFLQVDQKMVKQYSLIKQKVLENRDRIETCQDPKDLENIKMNMEKIAGVKIGNKSIRLNKETQKNLSIDVEEYRKIREQIQNCQQTIKDYCIKIVEIVTDYYDGYDKQNKKANAKSYFSLRAQLTEQFMEKKGVVEQQAMNSDLIDQIPKKTKQRHGRLKDVKKTQMNKSHKIIQQILDLYKNESL